MQLQRGRRAEREGGEAKNNENKREVHKKKESESARQSSKAGRKERDQSGKGAEIAPAIFAQKSMLQFFTQRSR